MPLDVFPSPDALWSYLMTVATDWGLKVVAAIVTWFIGRWLIRLVARFFERLLHSGKKIDRTLVTYLSSVISWLLTLILILGIFGIFGVQTTSFAALLAGVGLAVGTAWGGLLAHFAAGIFLQWMRPFNVGDTICAAGITGEVSNIGVFATTIITANKTQTVVPNNKLLSDNIQNFSAYPYRRVESSVFLSYTADVQKAVADLLQMVIEVDNVRADPPPVVSVAEYVLTNIRVSVSAYTAAEHEAQVLEDINRGIALHLNTLRTA